MTNPIKKEYEINVIKTPDGKVPTVESFHKVVDGLFGEVLDTRKDIAKLIPNLEKELSELRKILAQQMILFEVIKDEIKRLEKGLEEQSAMISNLQQATQQSAETEPTEAELTEESKKVIAKLIRAEIKKNTSPLFETLEQLEKEIIKSKSETLQQVEKKLERIKDQIEDLSSKTELQMLEILESVNPKPAKSQSRTSTKTKPKSTTKKRETA